MLGAEEFGFSTAPLIALGCIMMRKCHLNTCPVGVATQDPELRKKFTGQPEHLVNYFFLVAEEARAIMAELGLARFDGLIGRVDLLDTAPAIHHWKAKGLDLTPLLTAALKPHPGVEVRCTISQDHGLAQALDNRLIELAQPALREGKKVRLDLPIRNTNRTVGTTLSYQISKLIGPDGLPDDTIHFRFQGSAGQSFGAWLAHGVTLELEGDANDYVGKGLSGGRIIVRPDEAAPFAAEDQIIAGNVILYGATSGQLFLRGKVGERFCVRNSGATAVVEGVGDHGCEYMTGGRVVVLGPTGRNFGAGMSGGIAFVWDPKGALASKVNPELVELEPLTVDDARWLTEILEQHLDETGSAVAKGILESFALAMSDFIKVMPRDYRRVLEATALAEQEGRSVDEAVMAVARG